LNFFSDSYLRLYGKAEILKELVETLYGRFCDLSSYKRLFTVLMDNHKSKNILLESSIDRIISLLSGFNLPNIDEKLFPLYGGLCTTFSPFLSENNFVLLPSDNFSYFNFFDEFKVKDGNNDDPLFIATLPLYVYFTPLLVPAISPHIFTKFGSNNPYLLAEEIFGPAAIFATYFAEIDTKSLTNCYFLFKNELTKSEDLENTGKFYLELSQKSSALLGEIKQDNLKELNSFSTKWNLDKSVKLFKEYISLNIPPSEIYSNGVNEVATLPDIINASWFYLFENFSFCHSALDAESRIYGCGRFPISDFGNDKGGYHSSENGNSGDSDVSASVFTDITQFSDLCSLIIRGIETSNIFRRLL